MAELYRPYGITFFLDRCYDLAVHHDPTTGVVVLEYASQGRVVPTGTPCANRYISVLTIADRKVTHRVITSTRSPFSTRSDGRPPATAAADPVEQGRRVITLPAHSGWRGSPGELHPL